ncbi:alpha/beta hydrolase family protein [Peribacillus butanolivorans]
MRFVVEGHSLGARIALRRTVRFEDLKKTITVVTMGRNTIKNNN